MSKNGIDPNMLNRSNFEFKISVGKGGFGKVWKCYFKKTRKVYAIKEMNKARIIKKKGVHSVRNEREILGNLDFHLIANMRFAFQTRNSLYLGLDFMDGGDLRYHLCKRKFFSEGQTKFMIATLILSLEYIHNNDIIHRDVKPENLVFDSKGFLHLTDFGIARRKRPNNAKDTSGTPGYMAPEVMFRKNHSFEVDYYATGVILYEIIMGKRPYRGRGRKEIRDQIITKQAKITKSRVTGPWSDACIDFCNQLIQRKPNRRIGFNGAHEVKKHQWFDKFTWDMVSQKKLKSTFVPKIDNSVYKSICSSSEGDRHTVSEETSAILKKREVQEMFAGYGFKITQKKKLEFKPKKNRILNKSPPFGTNQTTMTKSSTKKSEQLSDVSKEIIA